MIVAQADERQGPQLEPSFPEAVFRGLKAVACSLPENKQRQMQRTSNDKSNSNDKCKGNDNSQYSGSSLRSE